MDSLSTSRRQLIFGRIRLACLIVYFLFFFQKTTTANSSDFIPQESVRSLRNTLHFGVKPDSNLILNSTNEQCGSEEMERKTTVLLSKALKTWANLSSSSCILEEGKQHRSWAEILATSLLDVSRQTGNVIGDNKIGRAEYGDAQCFMKVAVNMLRLLLLEGDETLSTLLDCSNRNHKSERRVETVQSRINRLVYLSTNTTHSWHLQAVAHFSQNNDDFSDVIKSLSKAQRRLLSTTAPRWTAEASACFNSADLDQRKHDNIRAPHFDSDKFDSGAVNAILYLSLGYVPNANCPTFNDQIRKQHHHVDDFLEVTPNYFEGRLKRLLNINESDLLTIEDFEHILVQLKIGISHEHEHGHDHDSEEHEYHEESRRKKRSVEVFEQGCFNAYELLEIYGFHSHNLKTISYGNLTAMFPAIIEQQLSNACLKTQPRIIDRLQPSFGQRFGLGTLAVFVVSFVSMVFLLIIPSTKRDNYRYIMSALIALSTSTMLGDALLHLLPQALAVHDHNHSGHADLDVVEVEDFVMKQLVALGAIYAFYLFQMLMSGRHQENNRYDSEGGHGHSHIPDISQLGQSHRENGKVVFQQSPPPVEGYDNYAMDIESPPAVQPSEIQSRESLDFTSTSVMSTFDNESTSGVKWSSLPSASSLAAIVPRDGNEVSYLSTDSQVTNSDRGSLKLNIFDSLNNFAKECIPKRTMGWMVIVGDAVHNIIDGVAIGAAFSEDLVSGLSTSVAIACHEIPHEVGDFAALLTAGLTWRAALFWNVVHTILAFVGLYIGLGIATEISTRQWVFALTAGMFIYVSLSEMMPELTRIEDNFWRYFIWQNIGLLSGFGIMLIIAIFEEQLANAIKVSYGIS